MTGNRINLNISHMRGGHQKNVKDVIKSEGHKIIKEDNGVIGLIFLSGVEITKLLRSLGRSGYVSTQTEDINTYYIEE